MARILVVEDENYQAMEMSWMIQDAGYSVVGPEASVEATRQVLAQQRVDLALLDVILAARRCSRYRDCWTACARRSSSSRSVRRPRSLRNSRRAL